MQKKEEESRWVVSAIREKEQERIYWGTQWQERFDKIKELSWVFESANKGIAVKWVCIALSILWGIQIQSKDQAKTVRETFGSLIETNHTGGLTL